jgi:hypothetical protein
MITLTIIKTFLSRCFCWPFGMGSTTGTIRLADDEEDKSKGPTSKRRALLVGISYSGPHNKWPALDGPHDDVDRFRQLLTGTWPYTSLRPFPSTTVLFPETYGYQSEDITVMRDDPNLPDLSHPTRDNMVSGNNMDKVDDSHYYTT